MLQCFCPFTRCTPYRILLCSNVTYTNFQLRAEMSFDVIAMWRLHFDSARNKHGLVLEIVIFSIRSTFFCYTNFQIFNCMVKSVSTLCNLTVVRQRNLLEKIHRSTETTHKAHRPKQKHIESHNYFVRLLSPEPWLTFFFRHI